MFWSSVSLNSEGKQAIDGPARHTPRSRNCGTALDMSQSVTNCFVERRAWSPSVALSVSPKGGYMGRQVHMWFSVLCLSVLMAVSNGHAQSASGTFTARIPFEFSAGNQLFPAGEYKLKALLQHTLSVSNQNRRAATN